MSSLVLLLSAFSTLDELLRAALGDQGMILDPDG